jgi:hypothetical protein
VLRDAGPHAAKVADVGPVQAGPAGIGQYDVRTTGVGGIALLGYDLAGDQLVDEPGGYHEEAGEGAPCLFFECVQ